MRASPLLSLTVLTALLAGPAASAQTAPPSFEGQVIYQVMPDRFFDGDVANNAGVDRGNLRAWHGGDLPGLTQKLPYITDLGATAVWLTPVYRQQAGNSFDTSAYHGYWPEDFRDVDPHFGTLAQFDAFVKAAQAANVRVVLDQVVNHYGYGATAVTAHRDWFTPQAQCDASQNKDVDCPLSGLPDLNQGNPQVRELLLGNAEFWRARGVSAFRYDAIRHVPQAFLKDLLARDRAAGTWTLGEWYDADTGTVAEWQKAGFDSLFLFSLQKAMKASLMSGQSLTQVRGVLERQDELPRPGEVTLFLDNHDIPRFAQGSLFADEGQLNTRYGLRALMTLKGVPVLYQGIEIAQRGGPDPDNRQDMRFEAQWTPGEKAVHAAARSAIAARKASPALSLGAQTLLPMPPAVQDDLLLLLREQDGQRVLVAWSGARQRRTYSLPLNKLGLSVGGQDLTKSLFADQNAGLSVKGGYLHVSIDGRDAAAFPLK
jgi:glycosidase